jgi:hypothetical protein
MQVSTTGGCLLWTGHRAVRNKRGEPATRKQLRTWSAVSSKPEEKERENRGRALQGPGSDGRYNASAWQL